MKFNKVFVVEDIKEGRVIFNDCYSCKGDIIQREYDGEEFLISDSKCLKGYGRDISKTSAIIENYQNIKIEDRFTVKTHIHINE